MSDAVTSHPSRMASRGMAPPPAKGSRTLGARPPNAARTSSRRRARSGEDSRPQWRTPPVVSSFSPRPVAFLATRPPIRSSSSRRPSLPGSSSRVASSTARPAARGRRAGQTCRVEMWPWRTFFSCTESMDASFSGNADSMRRRPSPRSLTATPSGQRLMAAARPSRHPRQQLAALLPAVRVRQQRRQQCRPARRQRPPRRPDVQRRDMPVPHVLFVEGVEGDLLEGGRQLRSASDLPTFSFHHVLAP